MRETPIISVLHPTARVGAFPPSLPLGWRHACESWYSHCDNPEQVEYVVCVDEPLWREFWSGSLVAEFPAWGCVRVVCNRGRGCYVDAVNAAASHARGRLLIGIADDFFPPEHWDSRIIAAVPDLDGEYVIHCGTGSPMDNKLITLPVMTRKRLGRTGYFFYPGYESMYSDNDLTEKARADGVVVAAREIVIEHRHPAFDKASMDSVYSAENRPAAYELGSVVLKARELAGFPDMPDFVPPASDVFSLACSPGRALVAGQRWQAVNVDMEPVPAAPRVLAVCAPGESVSSAWLANWTPLLAEMMQRFSVATLFSYSSNVYATRSMMLDGLRTLDPPADLVLWIDDDNLLSPASFVKLLFTLETCPDIDAVAAWCWVQPDTYTSGEIKVSCGRFGPDGECIPLEPAELAGGGLKPIDYTGFPAVLMRGSMLSRVGETPFAPVLNALHKWGFMGEDSSFFLRAGAAGCRLVVDADIHIPHLKLRPAGPLELVLPAEQVADSKTPGPRATVER